MSVKFYELAIGAVFGFRGKRYQKIAMSMARDEKRLGSIFMGGIDVDPEGVPLLLSSEEAARWKPDERDWTRYMSPAPGQRQVT